MANSSAPIEQPLTPAPPQPPLPTLDAVFTPPQIVDGIDPERTAPLRDAVADAMSNLSARVTRAVGLAREPTSLSDPTPPDPPALLLLGDSITEHATDVEGSDAPGWAARLAGAYGPRLDIFPRGCSGYNSRWMLHVAPSLTGGLAQSPRLRAVVIFLGANDAAVEGTQKHVPCAEYTNNLTKLVEFVHAMPAKPVPVLVTPPALGRLEDTTRIPDVTEQYAASCVDIARTLGVAVVDLHSAMVGRAGDKGVDEFLSDGLHLSASGNRLVFELLTEIFRECVPEISLDALPRHVPQAAEIDPANPAAMLGTSELV